jgi:DNA-binding NtrC family response regulator
MATNSSKLKILYCESDEELLSSQSAAMVKAGHQVQNAIGRKPAEEALRGASFDLVVLGSTLSKNDRHHLPYMAKKSHPETRVLVARTGGHHHEVDATVDAERGVEALLAAISSMIEKVPVAARSATVGR